MTLKDRIDALLDVYARCLAALRIAAPAQKDEKRKSEKRTQSPVRLARSLQTDRGKVEQAYASRLSVAGSALASGDAASRSALRRIVRRLRAALQSAMCRQPKATLDYDALRALSRSSRVGAIRAMDGLSVRLAKSTVSTASAESTSSTSSARGGSGSNGSKGSRSKTVKDVETKKPKSPKPLLLEAAKVEPGVAGAPQKTKPKQRSSQSSGKNKNDKNKSGKSENGKKRPGVRSNSETAPASAAGKTSVPPSGNESKSKTRGDNSTTPDHDTHGHGHVRDGSDSGVSTDTTRAGPLNAHARSGSAAHAHPGRRVSILTSSSASTKLGEIPAEKLRRRQPIAAPDTDGDERPANPYNIRPAYPMRPLWVHEKPVKKRFWSFGRS